MTRDDGASAGGGGGGGASVSISTSQPHDQLLLTAATGITGITSGGAGVGMTTLMMTDTAGSIASGAGACGASAAASAARDGHALLDAAPAAAAAAAGAGALLSSSQGYGFRGTTRPSVLNPGAWRELSQGQHPMSPASGTEGGGLGPDSIHSGEDTVERLNRFRKASGRNMRPSLERSVQHNRLQQQGGGQGASSTPTSGVGGVAGGGAGGGGGGAGTGHQRDTASSILLNSTMESGCVAWWGLGDGMVGMGMWTGMGIGRRVTWRGVT